MIKICLKIIAALTIFYFLPGSVVFAGDPALNSVGLLGGVGYYNTANGTVFPFGPVIARKISGDFALGASLQFVKYTPAPSASPSSIIDKLVLVNFAYFPTLLAGIQIGPEVGLDLFPGYASPIDSPSSNVFFTWGVRTAYDYKISDFLSIGAEANILLDDTSLVVDGLGVLKVWF